MYSENQQLNTRQIESHSLQAIAAPTVALYFISHNQTCQQYNRYIQHRHQQKQHACLYWTYIKQKTRIVGRLSSVLNLNNSNVTGSCSSRSGQHFFLTGELLDYNPILTTPFWLPFASLSKIYNKTHDMNCQINRSIYLK